MPAMSNSNDCVATRSGDAALDSSTANAAAGAAERAASSNGHAAGFGAASARASRTTFARYPACSTAATSVCESTSRATLAFALVVARSTFASATPRTAASACSTRRAQPPQVMPPMVSVTAAVCGAAAASSSSSRARPWRASAFPVAAGAVATVAR
ncbi:copper-translocating P-type ATPase domain protein [Burkholderia mallei]|nr:copper-translocating P-type ATPase domain protein [Burkholderia mallei]KOT12474.1 copper-translocating P-type ATPase domain protein [Burkholderia mallei]